MKIKKLGAGLLAVALAASSVFVFSEVYMSAEDNSETVLLVDGKKVEGENDELGAISYNVDGFDHTYKIEFPNNSKTVTIHFMNLDPSTSYTCDISWDSPFTIGGLRDFHDKNGILTSVSCHQR